ncbi:MAG: DUF3703 domain-containing protein [Marinobacter sp.]|uniref:DUF3703 domain-containing protein n=1 Tax=Marinobacter sp. AC-23 TaxID=1879031 RepID=UPI0008DE47A7|nr:DUF3703 domain-containing protein [Marinobacter sp. AC-23]OHY81472.1 hypothetical protein BCA33_11310 [Marinobacter sp. AC-23]
MHKELKQLFRAELAAAHNAQAEGEFRKAVTHLERAHILSQKFAMAHTTIHILMLKLAWRTGDFQEVLEPFIRAIAALLFSHIWVPPGNTGRSNASAFAPMPIPEDLAHILKEASEPAPR